MVTDFSFLLQSMAWPLVLLLAWFVGERLHELWLIPRVSSYVAVGLLGGLVNLPGLTVAVPGLPFLANVALSLVLFELGYRINLRWFRHNPWVAVIGVVESFVTFGLIYVVCDHFGLAQDVSLIIAALSISASPAGIVRVANELRSAGQVSERVLHLCAINCMLSVLALKLVVGYWHLNTSGDLILAAFGSIHVLFTSVGVGVLLGVVVPLLLRQRATRERGVTVVFALSVVLLTTMAYGLKLSPLLAALTFGVVARGRRVHLTNAQRDFGTAGDLLSLFLFVYIASLLNWGDVAMGVVLGVVLIAVRTLSKVACNVAAARLSGITERKGLLTGLALTPMSAFAILLLEQSRCTDSTRRCRCCR
jgi:Kef-type K+ transport system membrane component KefB